jgi:hypothetical protein
MEDLNVVRAGIPDIFGCPVLTRVKAFIVDQGSYVMLEHQFLDRSGRVIDISPIVGGPEPSDSISVPTGKGYVKLRIKEPIATGMNPRVNPIWEVSCGEIDPVQGIVRSTGLPTKTVEKPGIYELSFGVFDVQNRLLVVNKGMMSVERSIFPHTNQELYHGTQPITLQELRMFIMDSSPAENPRLADVEFGDEQIMLAYTKPILYWNEIPPPIVKFTTRTFPYRHHWQIGIQAELMKIAAYFYRRNNQKLAAAGVQADDLNREREYLAEGVRLWKEYADWCITEKIAINARGVAGAISSPYLGGYVGGLE